MIPMIAPLDDWHFAKDCMDEVQSLEKAPNIQRGMMVEVPSVIMLAAEFAKEVDFFFVGSNDLSQYILAVDRLHPKLALMADSLNPSVLRSIAIVTEAIHAEGKMIGVCGNMASDPISAKILIGLGVDELSVSGANVPAVKATIRNTSFTEIEKIADMASQSSGIVALRRELA